MGDQYNKDVCVTDLQLWFVGGKYARPFTLNKL